MLKNVAVVEVLINVACVESVDYPLTIRIEIRLFCYVSTLQHFNTSTLCEPTMKTDQLSSVAAHVCFAPVCIMEFVRSQRVNFYSVNLLPTFAQNSRVKRASKGQRQNCTHTRIEFTLFCKPAVNLTIIRSDCHRIVSFI